MRNHRFYNCILIIFTAAVFIVGVINGIHNKCFWSIDIANVFTILLVIIITYFVNQSNILQGNIVNHIEDVLLKLQNIIQTQSFYDVESKDYTYVNYLINSQRIKDYINCIKEYTKQNKSLVNYKDIEYIESEFERYNEFFSEHSKDLDFLKKAKSQLLNYSNNICRKINLMIVDLYTKS